MTLAVQEGVRTVQLALDQPQRVAVDFSQRRAVVTTGEHTWSVPLDGLGGQHVRWSVAALTLSREGSDAKEGTGVQDVEAWLTWRQSEEPGSDNPQELWRGTASHQWLSQDVELPEAGGTLTLHSAAPVAWAEFHLLPHGATGLTATRQPNALPNLVLVSIDTVRSDHLSAYGYGRPTSPQLERLAAESHLFERSFSASTWTLPSTASLLTGLLPAQHGLRRLNQNLVPAIDTLAEHLAHLGYCSAAITDGGFVSYGVGFAQGFERYDVTRGPAWATKDVAQIVQQAESWLAQHHGGPFFLFVHTYEAHQPHTNAEGFADDFIDPAYGGRFQQKASLHPDEADSLSDADRRHLVDLYDGEIRRADHYLGQLFDTLRQSPAWDHTAVLVTSDHGEEFFEHGDIDHGFGKVYDPNVRVPMIFKPPAQAQGTAVGQRFDGPVSGLDVVPTLLTLAGVELPEDLPGRSLVDTRGRVDPRPAPVLVHGTNSFPDRNEERWRLDEGDVAVIFDRVRKRPQWFDLTQDTQLQEPQSTFRDADPVTAARRLQTAIAWSSDGPFIARLDDDLTAVRIPDGSKIAPQGVWDGWSWHQAPAKAATPVSISVVPGQVLHLVFGVRKGQENSPWTLEVQRDGTGADVPWQPLTLETSTYRWHPFGAELPPASVLFPTAASFQPGVSQLTDAARRELEALGYL